MMKIISAIWNYIQINSIDFIAIIASIIIAIQTDKWIDNKKDREQKKRILVELPEEMNQLVESLKLEETNINNNMRHDKLTLNLYPYETPLWDSIKSTEKINIFSDCYGYKETLVFYENLKQLNEWENLMTKFVLFSNDNTKWAYQELLLKQIIEQRRKCICSAKEASDKLKEETKDGSTI